MEAASPGAGRPRHHHRLGGSSATLLLNKVISSRCTMGTSRMTSVRPSWSRGKMTTLSAGRSAWKLNQRRSRQQAGGAPPPPAVGPGVSPTPRLMQKPPRGWPGCCRRREPCSCGGAEEDPLGAGQRVEAAGGQPALRQESSLWEQPPCGCGGLRGTPRDLQNPGRCPQRVERRDRAEPTGHRPLWRAANARSGEAATPPGQKSQAATGSREPPSEHVTNGHHATFPPPHPRAPPCMDEKGTVPPHVTLPRPHAAGQHSDNPSPTPPPRKWGLAR